MPIPGGTTLNVSNACIPHLRNWYRSRLRVNSISRFLSIASSEPAKSTCTEWSTTKSTGTNGSIIFGSLPSRAAAERIAARSTSNGTPVKS